MKLLTFAFVLVAAISIVAQEPDRWRGMVLDESTTEDAIKVFGQPKKEQMNRLWPNGPVSSRLSNQHKKKIFKTLEFQFKKDDGVQKAILAYLNDKLVMITLDLKSGDVSPNGLSNIYGIDFVYQRTEMFGTGGGYPVVYGLLGTSERSFVSSFGSILSKSMGILGKAASYPGKVEFIDLISRSALENKDGSNILK